LQLQQDRLFVFLQNIVILYCISLSNEEQLSKNTYSKFRH